MYKNIAERILEAGIENCMFIMPTKPLNTVLFGMISYTSSSDPTFLLPATINEDRYKVSENYKITLSPTLNGFAKESFYVSDLQSLVNAGIIQFFVKQTLS